MSYTPPTGNAVAFDFPAKVYTPPAGDALDFEWNSSSAPLLADVAASSTATGALTTAVRLAGALSSSATAAAPGMIDGAVTAYFDAALVSTASVSGTLSTGIKLGASITAVSSVTPAPLTAAIRLDATGTASATASALLSSGIRLSGAAQAVSSALLDLSSAVRFDGVATCAATAGAALSTGIKLAGAVSAVCNVGKPLTRIGSVDAGYAIHTANTSPRSMAYGAGQFVVGARKALLKSADGKQWDALTDPTSPSVSDWYWVAYGAGRFVAARDGYFDTVWTSPDLVSWTEQFIPAGFPIKVISLVFVGGKFFVYGNKEPQSGSPTPYVVMASDDGLTWSKANFDGIPIGLNSGDYDPKQMGYCSGLYFQPPVDGVLYVSADLVTWEAIFLPFLRFTADGLSQDFATTNGVAVALVTNAANLDYTGFATTTNLRDWVFYTDPFSGDSPVEKVFGFDGLFFAQRSSVAMASRDGRNWSTLPAAFSASYYMYDGANRLVGVSGSSNYANTAAVYSITHDPSGTVLLNSGHALSGSAVVTHRVGNASQPAVESLVDVLPRAAEWSGLAFGNGVFVASSSEINQLHNLARSTGDGRWTLLPAPLHHSKFVNYSGYESLMEAEWAPIQFAAGRFWLTTSTTVDVTEQLDGSNYPAGYVAYYTTSEDGVTWAAPKAVAIGSVCAGNGVLVSNWSESLSGKIKTSVDGGDTWVSRSVLPKSTYLPIAFTNGYFFAVDTTNRTYYRSVDGINWDSLGTFPASGSPTDRERYMQVVGEWLVYFTSVYNGYDRTYTMWLSRTGDAWTSYVLPEAGGHEHGRIVYGNGLYVMIGAYTYQATDHLDGGTWTDFTLLTADAPDGGFGVFGNGVFVVLPSDDIPYRSYRLTQSRAYVGTVDLTDTPRDTSLSGDAVARASAQIDNRGMAHLEGAALCTCNATGALSARIRLAGTLASSIHRATGALSTAKPLGSAHAAASATAGGQLTTRVSLPTAHGACSATAAAGLDIGIRLAAAVATETFAGATTLDTAIHLRGNIGAVATAIPRLTAPSKYDDAPVICVKARHNVMYVRSDRI